MSTRNILCISSSKLCACNLSFTAVVDVVLRVDRAFVRVHAAGFPAMFLEHPLKVDAIAGYKCDMPMICLTCRSIARLVEEHIRKELVSERDQAIRGYMDHVAGIITRFSSIIGMSLPSDHALDLEHRFVMR